MRQVYFKINHPLRCCQEQHRVNPEHVTPPVSCHGAMSCDHCGAIRAALAAVGSLTGMENPWHSGGCLGSRAHVQPQNSHQLSRWGRGARCGAVHSTGQGGRQTRAIHKQSTSASLPVCRRCSLLPPVQGFDSAGRETGGRPREFSNLK